MKAIESGVGQINVEQSNSFLLCMVDGTLLGLEALAVRELLPLPLVTPLPKAPPFVWGIVNSRGHLVRVLDLREALGMPAKRAQSSDVLVVLEKNDSLFAIVVDDVRDVRALPQRDDSEVKSLIKALVPLEGEIAQLLRLESLAELVQISAAELEAGSEAAGKEHTLFGGVSPAELAIFEERARVLTRDYWNQVPLKPGEKAPGVQLLAAFALSGEIFGFDLSVVREFSPLRSLAPVPCSPPFIAGLMNLRGETLTLIDIRPALGLPQSGATPDCKVVVTQCDGLRVGIVVDEVLDVFSAETTQIAPATSSGDVKSETQALQGTLFFRDRMLGILDLSRLLQSEAFTI